MSHKMSHPLDILPAEMWEEIAIQLSPFDLNNFINSAPFFLAYFKPKQDESFMTDLLYLLADLHYLSTTDMLILRLVCRRWDKAIKDYYQRHIHGEIPFILEETVISSASSLLLFSLARFENDPMNGVATWLSTAQQTHSSGTEGNPILSRHLVLKDEAVSIDLRPAVLQIFQRYGRHLHRLTLEFSYQPGMLSQLYVCLKKWLRLAPNLKYLSVNCESILFQALPEERAELLDLIELHPLPELPHLTTLAVLGFPPELQNAFQQKYKKVETLHMKLTSQEYEALGPVQLWRVKTLQLTLLSQSDLITLKRIITPFSLQSLQTLKLEVLRREVRIERPPRPPKFKHLISFLTVNFKGARHLRKLELQLDSIRHRTREKVLKQTRKCRLKLPQVKHLQLRVKIDCPLYLDFLLPMAPSLRKLVVENPDQCFGNDSLDWNVALWEDLLSTDDFLVWGNVLRSSLWTLFPHLEFFRLERARDQGWAYRRKGKDKPIFIGGRGTIDFLSWVAWLRNRVCNTFVVVFDILGEAAFSLFFDT